MAENPEGDHELPPARPPVPNDDRELPLAPPVQPPPARPRFLGQWAPLVGVGVGTALYALAYVAAVLTTLEPGLWALAWAVYGIFLTIVLVIAGLILVIIERTRAFGAGILISIGVGLIVGGGVCIAILQVS